MSFRGAPPSVAFALSTRGFMFGGLETIADRLAEGMAQRGYAVSLLAGYLPGRPARQDWPADVSVRRVPVLYRDSPLARVLARLGRLPALHVQSISFVAAGLARGSTRRATDAADVLVTFLEGETTLLSRRRARRGRATIGYLAGVLDLRWAAADRSTLRLATSATLADEAARHGLASHGVLTPGIDAALLRIPRSTRAQCPARLVYVGRLEVNKRVDRLLPVLAGLPDVTLTVVGDGPSRAALERAATAHGLGERVAFRGALQRQGVEHELRAADLFVFPSQYESFGTAVLEAMAAGLPVVASDLPALREATGGHARLLPDDEPTWVDSARELLEDADAYARLSVEGRAWAANFTWERIAGRFEDYVQAALRSTTARRV